MERSLDGDGSPLGERRRTMFGAFDRNRLLRYRGTHAAPRRPRRPAIRARRLRPGSGGATRRGPHAHGGRAGSDCASEPRPPGRDGRATPTPVTARASCSRCPIVSPGGGRGELGIDLPPPGGYAVAHGLPAPTIPRSAALRGAVRPHLRRGGPARARLARRARATRGRGRAAARGARAGHPPALRRAARRATTTRSSGKLYVIRRRVERAAAAPRVPEASSRIVSLSRGTLVYKGLLTARQLAAYYPDLRRARDRERDGARPLALLDQHARLPGISRTRSTSSRTTARSTRCAATRSWLRAREPQLRSRAVRRRPAEAVPAGRRALVATRRSSTRPSSCSCCGGRSLPRTRSRC